MRSERQYKPSLVDKTARDDFCFSWCVPVEVKNVQMLKQTATCAGPGNMSQYSRIVADSICKSRILSEIRGYFHE